MFTHKVVLLVIVVIKTTRDLQSNVKEQLLKDEPLLPSTTILNDNIPNNAPQKVQHQELSSDDESKDDITGNDLHMVQPILPNSNDEDDDIDHIDIIKRKIKLGEKLIYTEYQDYMRSFANSNYVWNTSFLHKVCSSHLDSSPVFSAPFPNVNVHENVMANSVIHKFESFVFEKPIEMSNAKWAEISNEAINSPQPFNFIILMKILEFHLDAFLLFEYTKHERFSTEISPDIVKVIMSDIAFHPEYFGNYSYYSRTHERLNPLQSKDSNSFDIYRILEYLRIPHDIFASLYDCASPILLFFEDIDDAKLFLYRFDDNIIESHKYCFKIFSTSCLVYSQYLIQKWRTSAICED